MMSKLQDTPYTRPQVHELVHRLAEPRRFMQVVLGARQVGKTTLATQAAARLSVPSRYASADEPTLRGVAWLEQQWEAARLLVNSKQDGALLILDEIQKITGWSETVKRLWDTDSRRGLSLKVVLLESAPLLVQRGMSESLAGRFEVLYLPHWSYVEMRDAFGWSLAQYLFYGAYPGAAVLIEQPQRWARYIRDALIEPTISRDVLLLARVDKPALLRQVFELGCAYSGQILSYTKMLGQLQDAGNTTTLAHYLNLLAGAGMLTGLQRYSGRGVRQRASSPKLQVLNTALMTAQADMSFAEAQADHSFWGRLVESAIGAYLANAAAAGTCQLYYWRKGNHEVDFVLCKGRHVIGIEVKSTRSTGKLAGMAAFAKTSQPTRTLLVGGDGIDLETFLSKPLKGMIEAVNNFGG